MGIKKAARKLLFYIVLNVMRIQLPFRTSTPLSARL